MRTAEVSDQIMQDQQDGQDAPAKKRVSKNQRIPQTTIADVLRQLDVKVQDRLIVGLDGAYAPLDTQLRDNAELTLVTPMEGG